MTPPNLIRLSPFESDRIGLFTLTQGSTAAQPHLDGLKSQACSLRSILDLRDIQTNSRISLTPYFPISCP